MAQSAYFLDEPRRALVLRSIHDVCRHSEWMLVAAYVRTNHVHIVVEASTTAMRVVHHCKAYNSRALNIARVDPPGRLRWTRGFNMLSLRGADAIERAVRYVIDQGDPMALYVEESRTRSITVAP